MNATKNNAPRPSVRPSATQSPDGAHEVSAATPESLLVTRRRFLYGAVGAGALAAVGIGAIAYNAASGGSSDDVSVLKVPESSLTTLNGFTALDSAEGLVSQVGSFDIPYGTIVWANDDDMATCLLPTESGSPLAQVGILHLKSGTLDKVLEEAVGKADGFEIYDVRGNSSGIVWTEANIMEGAWRIHVAALTNGTLGPNHQVAEGDRTYETPTIAVAGNRAFWQVVPKDAEDAEHESVLMAASFTSSDATEIFRSRRHSATPVYGTSDSVIITPRSSASGTYYQLTCIDAQSGDVTDTCTLPQGMVPLESGYGETGFMFSFSNIYDYGDGISNLGTYTPLRNPGSGSYSDAEWFGFARTPSAPPAWANDLLIVKSSYSVCGVDLEERTYFALDVENGADTYGEYLASTGTHNTFVTYTNIDHTPVGAEKIHTCRVKVWQPLSKTERAQAAKQQQEAQQQAQETQQA